MRSHQKLEAPVEARRQVATKAFFRAAADWGIGSRELAGIIGVSTATLYRLQNGDRLLDLDQKEGELALLFLRSYRSLDALVGGDAAKARLWLTHENKHLRAIPLELLTRVEGLVRVANYLDAMRAKV